MRHRVRDFGSCLSFALSTTQHVLLKSGRILSGQSSYTISLWMRDFYKAGTAGTALYCERAPTGSNILKLQVSQSANPGLGKALELVIRDDAATLQFISTGRKMVTDGLWHHVAVTNTAGTIQFYVDGVADGLAATQTPTNNFTNANAQTRLGGDPQDANVYMAGWLDEVQLYTTGLTAAQVQQLYYDGAPLVSAGLVGWYKLDEGTGSIVNDASGTQSTGSLQNSPSWSTDVFMKPRDALPPTSVILPSAIANLQLWLKADTGVFSDGGTTIASPGSTVQQWNDQSGNNNHATQSNGSLRPVYQSNVINGMPAVLFSNVAGSYLSLASSVPLSPTSAVTVCAVHICNNQSLGTNGVQGIVTKDIGGTGATNPPYGIGISSNKTPVAYATNDADTISPASGGAYVTGNAYSSVQVYGSGTNTLFINGVQSSVTGSLAALSATTGSVMIGQQKSGLARSFDGYVAEVLLYSAALTAVQRQAIEAYFSKKYGITQSVGRGSLDARQSVRDAGTCLSTGNFAGSVNAGAINLSGSAVTIAVWVNFRAFQTASPFISTVAGIEAGSTQTALLRMGDATLANNKAQFVISNGTIQIKLNSTQALITNRWYHIAAVYSGTNMYLYINGVQDAVQAQTGSIAANGTFFVSLSNSSRQMNGCIDDVMAYTRALSPAEVVNLYNGRQPSANGLRLYYKFDEGSGTTVIDSSGNGSNGTSSGATYATDVSMKLRPSA